jgi:hypothetical protein
MIGCAWVEHDLFSIVWCGDVWLAPGILTPLLIKKGSVKIFVLTTAYKKNKIRTPNKCSGVAKRNGDVK